MFYNQKQMNRDALSHTDEIVESGSNNRAEESEAWLCVSLTGFKGQYSGTHLIFLGP